jgi:GrpB-like predicted nucleotidyltransferase (UPF0157 family)
VRRDKILIEDYDPTWPELFEAHRLTVTNALQKILVHGVEHIGSTSVPGLPAKRIIDMLAVIDDYDNAGPGLEQLTAAGWIMAPEEGDQEARKYSMCYPSVERRTHHLHVVEPDWGWQNLLLFRDYLRAHPAAAADYAALKRRLAAADDEDRPRYRSAKAPFIWATLADAQRWHTGRSQRVRRG